MKRCCNVFFLLLCLSAKMYPTSVGGNFIQEMSKAAQDTMKIAALINNSASSFPKDISKFVKPAANTVLNVAGLVDATLRLIESDFTRMIAHLDCVITGDQKLVDMAKGYKPPKKKDESDLSCPAIGCTSSRACLAQTTKQAVKVLRPFVTHILGESKFNEKTDETDMAKGLILNLNDLSLVAFDVVSKVTKNNENMKQILDKLTKFVEDARKVETTLCIVLSTMMSAFDIVALVIGGNDYIDSLPAVDQDKARDIVSEVVKTSDYGIQFDDDFEEEVKSAKKNKK